MKFTRLATGSVITLGIIVGSSVGISHFTSNKTTESNPKQIVVTAHAPAPIFFVKPLSSLNNHQSISYIRSKKGQDYKIINSITGYVATPLTLKSKVSSNQPIYYATKTINGKKTTVYYSVKLHYQVKAIPVSHIPTNSKSNKHVIIVSAHAPAPVYYSNSP